MPATRRRRTTAEQSPRRMTVHDYATAAGYELVNVGDVEVAAKLEEIDGERVVMQAIVDLPGSAGDFAIIQTAAPARDRWMIGVNGWLEHEFATLHAAVEAVRDPKVRGRMREYVEARVALRLLEQRVRDLAVVPGALEVTL